jgi:hypothetical protein
MYSPRTFKHDTVEEPSHGAAETKETPMAMYFSDVKRFIKKS